MQVQASVCWLGGRGRRNPRGRRDGRVRDGEGLQPGQARLCEPRDAQGATERGEQGDSKHAARERAQDQRAHAGERGARRAKGRGQQRGRRSERSALQAAGRAGGGDRRFHAAVRRARRAHRVHERTVYRADDATQVRRKTRAKARPTGRRRARRAAGAQGAGISASRGRWAMAAFALGLGGQRLGHRERRSRADDGGVRQAPRAAHRRAASAW
mmetsp:Transcript_3471/g.10854  ORF Transcript_3471/g.10854 Transcript_3471/m.10854 type:complete len:214 (-) Transcript_3471:194-835(-)